MKWNSGSKKYWVAKLDYDENGTQEKENYVCLSVFVCMLGFRYCFMSILNTVDVDTVQPVKHTHKKK